MGLGAAKHGSAFKKKVIGKTVGQTCGAVVSRGEPGEALREYSRQRLDALGFDDHGTIPQSTNSPDNF